MKNRKNIKKYRKYRLGGEDEENPTTTHTPGETQLHWLIWLQTPYNGGLDPPPNSVQWWA